MPVLRFKAEDVRRVVEHSIAAPKQSEQVVEYVPHTTKPIAAPAVLLVHDQGVYLVSSGKPRDIVGADATDRKDAAKDEGRSFCAYAIGCHPGKDADWYETARGLVSGDDFVETLPWARKLKALIDGGARIITLRMTRDSIEIVHTVRLAGHEESFEVATPLRTSLPLLIMPQSLVRSLSARAKPLASSRACWLSSW